VYSQRRNNVLQWGKNDGLMGFAPCPPNWGLCPLNSAGTKAPDSFSGPFLHDAATLTFYYYGKMKLLQYCLAKQCAKLFKFWFSFAPIGGHINILYHITFCVHRPQYAV
jgi:hypothetical protein